MEEISISEFKAKCLAIVERVRRTRKPVRITRFGKVVGELIPPSPVKEDGEWLGRMRGTAKIVGDIVSPATDASDWEVLHD
ncbi:MAG TPA: type II toxin-antitoxin system Phd/YefM family antitoxin [Candidatus Angelobacter sp.]|nr:type II toxin-antitoxin system Phd/YefM family antitoxin [Candidatus Angelobacter sp.]